MTVAALLLYVAGLAGAFGLRTWLHVRATGDSGFHGISGMGPSWRIGVDEAERTDLVTGGVSAVVRNPIFTAMGVTQTGLTLAVPTVVSVAALGCLVLAVSTAGPGARGAVPAPAARRRLLRLRDPHRPVPPRRWAAAPRLAARPRLADRHT